MKRRFIELVGWKRGQLTFTTDVRCSDEETVPEAFNPFELIARGIVEGYSQEDLTELLGPLEPSLIVPLPRAQVSTESLKLDAAEKLVFELVDGRQTLSQIVAEGSRRGIPKPTVLRAVYIALSGGLFVSPAWPPAVYRQALPTLHDG